MVEQPPYSRLCVSKELLLSKGVRFGVQSGLGDTAGLSAAAFGHAQLGARVRKRVGDSGAVNLNGR